MAFEDIYKNAKFNEKGLIPVIVQDYKSKTVLMMAYMNTEALEKTIESGYTHFWSRSRGILWMKGETSGHVQKVVSMALDCDSDTLLINVEQKTAACHTGTFSCFSTVINAEGETETSSQVFNPDLIYAGKADNPAEILQMLYGIILDRKANPKEGSYTNYLFEKGQDKILKKVGEEASEVIIASKNDSVEEIVYEVSDLIYHLLVLLANKSIKPEEIYGELKKRHKPRD